MNLIAQKLIIKGKSQAWLVRRIKKLFPKSRISRQYLNRIVNTDDYPNLLNAHRISKALDCAIEEVWILD